MGNRRTLLAYLMGTFLLLLLGAGVFVLAEVDLPEVVNADPEASRPVPSQPTTTEGVVVLPGGLDFGPGVPPDPSPTTIPPERRQTSPSVEPEAPETGGEGGNDSPPDRPPDTASPEEVGPIMVSGESGVLLENLVISNPDGPCVEIKESSDVVLRNARLGPCGGKAVEIEDSSSVKLDSLTIRDTESGVYAVHSQGITVINSVFRDSGRNFVQFDKVTGSGNQISNNTGRNQLGGSDAEDFVSVYQSSGTAGSPLLVTGNSFSNGGPSTSGSGIMVGDLGGANIVVEGNSLTNPGQVGIGVPGGSNIRVVGNAIFSSPHPWSNVGIYVWNQSGGGCSGIEVSGNRVEWYKSDGSPNPAWDGGNCGAIAGWDSNDWDADLG